MEAFNLIFARTIFLFSIILNSCGATTENGITKPNKALAEEFGIKSSDLLLQRYQKFGFTDICEDIRMIAKCPSEPLLTKSLPISPEDLNHFNRTTNKVDSLNGIEISTSRLSRSFYQDIELEYVNFVANSNVTVQLSFGEFELTKLDYGLKLTVYDRNNQLIYIEVHRCDGK